MTKHKKYNTQESQDVCPFPGGDHKAAKDSQDSITQNACDWYNTIIKIHKLLVF